jgi:hypothetical protein
MYRRVEKAKFEVPGSNYAIAQQHLARPSIPIAASSKLSLRSTALPAGEASPGPGPNPWVGGCS